MKRFPNRFLAAASTIALLIGCDVATAGNAITLTGTVPQSCSLVANTGAGATGIALQTTQTALAVGSVDESCNDDAGYTVGMVTTNGVTSGMFKSGVGDATHQLVYNIKYAGVAATPIAGFVNVTDTSARVGGTGTVNKPVTIAFTGATSALASGADYSDTLTFTMTAK
jgi:hypothetical protein